MPKLTDTQSNILRRAATRPDNLAMPLPEGLAGAAAKMAVAKMIEHGWLEEVEANLRRGDPLWRETGDGHGTTLIATEAGLDAIGIEPIVATTMTNLRKVKLNLASAAKEPAETSPDADTPQPVAIRAGTKQAQIIALLQRPEGASIGEIVEATGWLPHSARGLISGGLKKKLGLPIISQKLDQRGTVYRIPAA
ncbi:DUF3489 domain-containing protein [Thalassobacter stenotrophicus]|uniref:DUF3489 domain-containing protein n=1 Tax=Thalassobacter stenotrophicus TaxID=266809 RepID=UPI000D5CCAF1|nr:DUF3489 domain-containing protein [Thalassobacter stenotrophicus]PVZ48628.1 hypothetical protein DD557_07730 [Thalassobacter stenotrophicus]